MASTSLQVAHALNTEMLVARSSSRAWAVAPARMGGYVGGPFAGMVNIAMLPAK
jgi:hypothetical protein